MQQTPKNKVLMIMYGKQVGGAELQFIELANYLAGSYSVRLLSMGGGGCFSTASIDHRVELKVYEYDDKLTGLWMLFRAWIENLSFISMATISTSFIPDLVGFSINIFSRSKLISLQTVSVCVGHPTIDQWLLRRFDYLVAGADDIKTYLINHKQAENKIKVIHNWVDFSKRSANLSAQEAKVKFGVQGKFVIACIGRLHIQKGQIYLIRAFAALVKKESSCILILAGGGVEKERLQNEINRLGIQQSVFMLGEIGGADYNEIFNAIDIYVQPSLYEGLPRTLLDAMYYSKPVIATAVNGNIEAIQDGVNGMLVPAQDDQALFNAILFLMQNGHAREKFAKMAHETVVRKFDMNNQLRKICTLFSE